MQTHQDLRAQYPGLVLATCGPEPSAMEGWQSFEWHNQDGACSSDNGSDVDVACTSEREESSKTAQRSLDLTHPWGLPGVALVRPDAVVAWMWQEEPRENQWEDTRQVKSSRESSLEEGSSDSGACFL